jgi:initiation factor 1A
MVKNSKGGKGSKKQARKSTTSTGHSSYLRLSTSEHEEYGEITKVLGNGMYNTRTKNDYNILLHIRGKFRKTKIEKGNYVLIGLREYEKPYKNGDILEVYTDEEVTRLSKLPQLEGFINNKEEKEEGEIEFTTKEIIEEKYEKIEKKEEEEEIDIEEI